MLLGIAIAIVSMQPIYAEPRFRVESFNVRDAASVVDVNSRGDFIVWTNATFKHAVVNGRTSQVFPIEPPRHQGRMGAIMDINDNGVVLGLIPDPHNGSQLVLWKDGIVDYSLAPKSHVGSPRGGFLNNRGDIVLSSDLSVWFLRRDNQWDPLVIPIAHRSPQISGISESGVVVGVLQDSNLNKGIAASWGANGLYIRLEQRPNWLYSCAGLELNGTIYGSAEILDTVTRKKRTLAIAWTEGRARILGGENDDLGMTITFVHEGVYFGSRQNDSHGTRAVARIGDRLAPLEQLCVNAPTGSFVLVERGNVDGSMLVQHSSGAFYRLIPIREDKDPN